MIDSEWMRLALTEARNGIGLTSPNPAVGAVIVKNDQLLGRGWHHRAGRPHAEREAIAAAIAAHGKNTLHGATIFVTLEPCSTQGRTPACVDGIVEAGISRVVYGAKDPNPAHAGNADHLLRQRGIEVISGVERETCEFLIKEFTKRITTSLPWVIAKTAMSLDGRITRPKGEGQWLTGEKAREEVHHIRAAADAIITGGKTVRKDNPSLTVRGSAYRENKPQPWRVVLTNAGKQSLPDDAHLFSDKHADRTLLHQDKPLDQTLRELADLGCNTVMLECGGILMRQFLEQGLVDEVALFLAPIFTGGNDFGFGIGKHLESSYHLQNITTKTLGNDTMIRGILKKKTDAIHG